MNLTTDSQVVLLLCSHLGLPADADPTPLTLREWNPLVRKLQASSLERPGVLLGLSAAELQAALDLTTAEAERLARLLERGGALAIELERLASLGIWALTRADESYPQRLRQRLKESAPAVIFGAGDLNLLGQPGLAVVGARNIDEAGTAMAEFVGNACARCGLAVYSGGARGVDAVTMGAALEARGAVVGALADSLERALRAPDARSALAEGTLTLITPYSPNAGFSVGAAMGRNKMIYALADYALVISCDAEKGGTWAGATEAIKAGWVPVFVRAGLDAPDGNRLLLQRGALPFPDPFDEPASALADWLASHSPAVEPAAMVQASLL